MSQLANFTVTLSTPSDVPVTVDYVTVDMTALAYRDYIFNSGTLTFPPGQTTRAVEVKVIGSPSSLISRKFKLLLSNPQAAVLGVPASVECAISGPPSYASVPFPGRRLAALGDSITYANNLYNPLSLGSDQGPTPKMRNEYYSTGASGYIAIANQLLNNALSLQAALQPNTNPGADSTAPHVGYNFAIYSSRVSQWMLPDFDPAPIPPTVSHNIGPMLNALNYLDKFDMAVILGGTNDASGKVRARAILQDLMSYSVQLAQAGKWVFLSTLTPRTADLLQLSPTGAGYNQIEVQQIMQTLLDVNQGLRDWLTPAEGRTIPNNIFLVDAWDKLVGPTASIIPGIPTDPAGLLSPSSGIVKGALIPSTPGNYRTDAPNLRFMYDGLHMAQPAAYVQAKELVRVMKAVGVPKPVSKDQEGGSTVAGAAPLTFGPNLMANKTMARSTNGSRAVGTKVFTGRAIGLGSPIPVAGFSAPTNDAFTNQGAGYTHGHVPDYWFVYRASNADSESFSNFNGYTYVALNSKPDPAPMSYQANATWADGCLKTALVNETFELNGESFVNEPGFALTFTRPAGVIGSDTVVNNAAFQVRYILGEGQYGPMNSWGYEEYPRPAPVAPPYSPSDAMMMDCILKFSGLSPNLSAARVVANFLCIDYDNGNTNPAVISAIANSESWFPFKNIANCRQHTEDRYVAVRCPIVRAPSPATGETASYAQMCWQFSFDCQALAAAGTITILRPRMCKVTVPSGM
ncbi:Calx-beta domain-containing protein [Roseococcus sp.]|uniref:Calx-beta domain-containing protein n=1 Tax=Roseococcus sp. TaxID=2109646 RepID=UPI003BA953B5